MQTVTPSPPRHQPACEFVNDNDLTFLNHIVLVTVIQVIGPQRRIQMMHERNIGRVIQGRPFRNKPHT